MVFLGTSSCASGHKKTFFQVLCFYLLVRTQDVCYTNRLMRTIQKSSLWWSFLLLQRIYEDFFVGTWKCPHNLNRPHFAGVYTYECPHRCAKVHAHTHTHIYIYKYINVGIESTLAYIYIYIFIYLCICLSVYLRVCLSVCQSIYLSISLSVYLSIDLSICFRLPI